MKVTLDLTRLQEEGKITPAESERLMQLAARDTGSLGINILVGFGVVAVSAGAVALVPSVTTGVVIGGILFAIGLILTLARADQWQLLAQICVVIGALMAAAGTVVLGKGSLVSLLLVAGALAVASVIARSGLVMAMAVLALAACLGARTGYWHATYALAIYEPTVTVVSFSILALGAYLLSKQLRSEYERLAIAAARTSVFLVNFGFWVGSLWGDRLMLFHSLLGAVDNASRLPVVVPRSVFSVGWALALLGVGIWGVRVNRRWVVNVAAVFGAIHFYTQWFERLGASPLTVLLAGVLMLAFALGLWTFNRRAGSK